MDNILKIDEYIYPTLYRFYNNDFGFKIPDYNIKSFRLSSKKSMFCFRIDDNLLHDIDFICSYLDINRTQFFFLVFENIPILYAEISSFKVKNDS